MRDYAGYSFNLNWQDKLCRRGIFLNFKRAVFWLSKLDIVLIKNGGV